MINLSMNIVLLISIINTYLRDKYQDLVVLCECEMIDYHTLMMILDKNHYYYDENAHQIKEK